MILKLILQCFAVVIGATAFVPLIPSSVWWIRGFEFPRMQILMLGLITSALLVFAGFDRLLLDLGILGFLLLSVAFQAYRIWPYSKLSPFQVLPGENDSGICLFIVNVLMSNRNAEGLLALIREKKPDVILALETDRWWVEQLGALAADYPHAVEVPQDDTYGMLLRSRLPLLETVVKRMVRPNIPSIHARLQLENGQEIHFYAVHPKPPFPDEAVSTVKRDAELLLIGQQVAKHRGPAIVAGDLNDVAWSQTTHLFQKISGLLDPRIGRGRFNTYHASHWWLRWPLDHVFLSDHFRLRRLQVQPHIGSDHLPILADLSFEPASRHQQDGPDGDQEDQKEVRQKISRARK